MSPRLSHYLQRAGAPLRPKAATHPVANSASDEELIWQLLPFLNRVREVKAGWNANPVELHSHPLSPSAFDNYNEVRSARRVCA